MPKTKSKVKIPKEVLNDRRRFKEFIISSAEDFYKEYLGQLYKLWEKWNQSLFDSKLPEVPYISFGTPTNPRRYGQYSSVSDFGGRAEIKIRESLLTGTHPDIRSEPELRKGRLLFVQDILLHEMIHQYQYEYLDKPEGSYDGHGPRFRDAANTVSARLGIQEEVRASKVRKQQQSYPSCAYWPHNVRPRNYYMGAYVPNEKRRTSSVEALAGKILSLSASQKEELRKVVREKEWILTITKSNEEGVDLISQLYRCVSSAQHQIERVPIYFQVVIQKNLWQNRVLPNGMVVKHDSFRDFMTAHPPRGFGMTVETLREICRLYPDILQEIDTLLED